jgi:ABC-type antimicrobial peptide transport system permease subunit
MLGIIIGVLSVVVLMAFGAGVQKEMLSQMSSLINNNITISPKG